MQTLQEYIRDNYNGSPTWFQDIVNDSWQQRRINNILSAKEYLAGKHLIKQRQIEYYNNKAFIPAAITLNYVLMLPHCVQQ